MIQKRSRNNIFIKSFTVFAVVSLLISSCISCTSQANASAHDVLLAMTAAAGSSLPSGDVYVLPNDISSGALAPTDQANASWRIADNSLLYAAFGSDHDDKSQETPELSQEIVDSGALFLSTAAQPDEYVVLRCVSRSDTDLIADLLLRRLDVLRRQYRGTEQQAIVENGRVVILGKYVILVVAQNVEDGIEAAKSAVR